jgi:hypothetical protein
MIKRLSKGSISIAPILFSFYAPLSLYRHNLGEIRIEDIYRSLAFSALSAIILCVLFWVVFRSIERAAILSSLSMVLIFSYGHVYSQAKHLRVGDFILGRHRYLLILWAVLGLMAIYAIGIRSRVPESLSRFLSAFAGILFLIPLFPILQFHLWTDSRSLAGSVLYDIHEGVLSPPEQKPDVYYFIVDEYARWDVLEETYDYDNGAYKEFLETRGFYVASWSETNYPTTKHSLASSLNMHYIQDMMSASAEGSETGFSEFMTESVQHSLVREIFDGMGYKTVGFATGYLATEFFDADYVFTPDMGNLDTIRVRFALNSYESMLIENSILKALLDLENLRSSTAYEYIWQRMQTPFSVQRETILAIFDNLEKVTRIPEPKFVFVHIVAPHPPALFGRNGERIYHNTSYSLESDSGRNSQQAYLDELYYITTRLEDTVDFILTNSARPVAIILQSDHGASPSWHDENRSERTIRDRLAIVNAYHFPDACQEDLYPTISPVNSFRTLFNCSFGGEFEILEDESYIGYDTFTPADEFILELPLPEGKD